MNNSGSGGLNGLVETFKDNWLGDVVSSWVGTGQNIPINADQIQQVLVSEAIQGLAAKAGLPADAISSMLAEHLPGFVDRMIPDGSIPEGGGLIEQGLSFLCGKIS